MKHVQHRLLLSPNHLPALLFAVAIGLLKEL